MRAREGITHDAPAAGTPLETYRPVEEGAPVMAGEKRRRARPPQGRRPQKSNRGMSGLSWIALIVLSLVGLISGAAAVFVATMPKDFVRDRITAEVKRQTGRDLIIAGPASFKFYPSLGFSLSDVSLSSPSDGSAKPLVSMASLDVSVRLLALLQRQVTIEHLVLQKPVFELHIDASGRKTWDMAGDSLSRPLQLAQAGGTASDAPGGLPKDAQEFLRHSGTPERGTASDAAAGLDQLEFGDVRVEDGTVHYSDARSGARQDATSINMRLALQSIRKPLEAAGDLVWNGEKVTLDGALASIKAVLELRPAKLTLNVASRLLTATYDGTVLLKEAIDAEGALAAKTDSVKGLAKWLGMELPPVPGLGPLDVNGQMRAAGRTISLSNANLSLDGATGTGQFALDMASPRAYLKGALKLSALDLNKYIGSDGSTAGGDAQKAAAPAATGSSPPDSIGDLIGDPSAAAAPQVKGFAQRDGSGWSEGQIDASALGLADADLKLTLGQLLIKDVKVGQSQLTVALKNSVMKTTFDDVQLYGGQGKGFVTFDAATPNIAAIGANLTLDGVAGQPLLKDAAGMDWLAGNAKLTLIVSGQGQSQRQIVETLTGTADLSFANGAIVGWDVPGIIRGLTQGKLAGLDRSPSQKTDFSELVSTWRVSNGLAQNDDLRLVSPLLRVAGSGNVMLPAREIDYTLRPTLVARAEGQGANGKASGLEVPVHVTGSWDKPKLTPDASGILKDPNQAVEAVKELGKKFKGKSADEIVDSLLGGKKSGGDGAAEGGVSDKDKAKQLLEGLFKR